MEQKSMDHLSDKLVNKLTAKAIFRRLSLDGLDKIQESLSEVVKEKKDEEAKLNSKLAKQSTAIHAATKILAEAGLALDPTMLSDDEKKVKKVIIKQEKRKNNYPNNQHKYKITDKDGNTRYWSGCGHPPPQFKQVFDTAKPKPRKDALLAVIDYKYPHAFNDLRKCEKV